MSEFDYINRTYDLNIKAGTRCVYTGGPIPSHLGMTYPEESA